VATDSSPSTNPTSTGRRRRRSTSTAEAKAKGEEVSQQQQQQQLVHPYAFDVVIVEIDDVRPPPPFIRFIWRRFFLFRVIGVVQVSDETGASPSSPSQQQSSGGDTRRSGGGGAFSVGGNNNSSATAATAFAKTFIKEKCNDDGSGVSVGV